MIVFTRADQRLPNEGQLPPRCTWDYAPKVCDDGTPLPKAWNDDLVYATCANGHTLRLVSTVHAIAADGSISPSYVCSVTGCTFHEHVRLEGWDPNR